MQFQAVALVGAEPHPALESCHLTGCSGSAQSARRRPFSGSFFPSLGNHRGGRDLSLLNQIMKLARKGVKRGRLQEDSVSGALGAGALGLWEVSSHRPPLSDCVLPCRARLLKLVCPWYASETLAGALLTSILLQRDHSRGKGPASSSAGSSRAPTRGRAAEGAVSLGEGGTAKDVNWGLVGTGGSPRPALLSAQDSHCTVRARPRNSESSSVDDSRSGA